LDFGEEREGGGGGGGGGGRGEGRLMKLFVNCAEKNQL